MERKTAVPVNTGTTVQIDTEKIPTTAAYVFTRTIHQTIWQAWNDPVCRAEYEKWKQERANAKA